MTYLLATPNPFGMRIWRKTEGSASPRAVGQASVWKLVSLVVLNRKIPKKIFAACKSAVSNSLRVDLRLTSLIGGPVPTDKREPAEVSSKSMFLDVLSEFTNMRVLRNVLAAAGAGSCSKQPTEVPKTGT